MFPCSTFAQGVQQTRLLPSFCAMWPFSGVTGTEALYVGLPLNCKRIKRWTFDRKNCSFHAGPREMPRQCAGSQNAKGHWGGYDQFQRRLVRGGSSWSTVGNIQKQCGCVSKIGEAPKRPFKQGKRWLNIDWDHQNSRSDLQKKGFNCRKDVGLTWFNTLIYLGFVYSGYAKFKAP